MQNYQKNSDQELNEQINDKLSQLWTGMKSKKDQIMRNLTPGYSRRTDQSDSNIQAHNFLIQNGNQLIKMKQKLACQSSARKNRQTQIDKLKKTISQLTNDKRILVAKLEQLQQNNSGSGKKYNQSVHTLNQSSIQYSNVQGKTANFSTNKKKLKQTNFDTVVQKQNKVNNFTAYGQDNKSQSFQNLSKKRLIQLLKSTSQYRQFAYYYDSHQLSYLKRLQDFHKKNCEHLASQRQKRYWAPQQILQNLKLLNKTQNFQLSEANIQLILSEIKFYYQINQQERIKKMKVNYENKQKKIRREYENSIPYDIVRLSKAKQRQFVGRRKRTNTLK